MGYSAPRTKPTPTPDPLINLGATSADVQNQRNKRGFLSSFLQGGRNRGSGFMSSIANTLRNTTLGNTTV